MILYLYCVTVIIADEEDMAKWYESAPLFVMLLITVIVISLIVIVVLIACICWRIRTKTGDVCLMFIAGLSASGIQPNFPIALEI